MVQYFLEEDGKSTRYGTLPVTLVNNPSAPMVYTCCDYLQSYSLKKILCYISAFSSIILPYILVYFLSSKPQYDKCYSLGYDDCARLAVFETIIEGSLFAIVPITCVCILAILENGCSNV